MAGGAAAAPPTADPSQIADAVMYIHRTLGVLGFDKTLQQFERELELLRESSATAGADFAAGGVPAVTADDVFLDAGDEDDPDDEADEEEHGCRPPEGSGKGGASAAAGGIRELPPPFEQPHGEGKPSDRSQRARSDSSPDDSPRKHNDPRPDRPRPAADADGWKGDSDPGFVVADGSPDDLWGSEALDTDSPQRAPRFPHGGGITLEQYEQALAAERPGADSPPPEGADSAAGGTPCKAPAAAEAAPAEESPEAAGSGDAATPPPGKSPAEGAEPAAASGGVDSDAPYAEVPVGPHVGQPPTLEQFQLPIIYKAGRTGFEEDKDFPIDQGVTIAGRYQIMEYLGSAAFSRAVQCTDRKTGELVAIKIIKNNKDFLDQSLDEIKLLQYINRAGDADENCVLQLFDFFYYKEHLFIVSELLRDNLYDFSKFNRDSGGELYFTVPRLQKITTQILVALAFIHNLGLMHCDLKPENILIRSFSRCEVKVIDFGSSCFTTDHLSSYVQSRCYRAPEVVLGTKYGQKIDVWSLGAILPELYTGHVLFQNDSVPTMLARISAICGPLPLSVVRGSRHAAKFMTRYGVWYERRSDGALELLFPKRTTLRRRMQDCDDQEFVDFVASLVNVDPTQRPTARDALRLPWLTKDYGPIPPPV